MKYPPFSSPYQLYFPNIHNIIHATNNAQNLVAAAILGGYFGLFILIKIKGAISGGKSVEEEPAPVVVAVPSSRAGAIPDVDSEEFGSFLESEENVMKLVESFEK